MIALCCSMPAAMHRRCDMVPFCVQKGEEVAAPAEAAFPAEPSASEAVPEVSTVLGYSPQLQLTLHRSNFAGLDDGDDGAEASNNQSGDVAPGQDPSASEAPDDDASKAAARGPGSSSAVLSPPAAANGMLHPDPGSKAGSGQVDWRIGLPEGLCKQADRLEGQRQLPAPTDTAHKKTRAAAEASAEDRTFFGTVGHLYASARVELIRLAAALSLHSNFSPTKRVGGVAGGEAEAEQSNGLSSPERPAREPGSSLNWLSPMRLPLSPARAPPKAAAVGGRKGSMPDPTRVAPPLLPAAAQQPQPRADPVVPGQTRPPSRLRHASSADAVTVDAVRYGNHCMTSCVASMSDLSHLQASVTNGYAHTVASRLPASDQQP